MTTLWWDATTRQFRGVYCTSSNAQGCSPLTLDWTGTQAVVKGSYQLGTKTHRFMDVYTFDSPESYTRTHAVGEPSVSLKRVSTTRATIVKDKAR